MASCELVAVDLRREYLADTSGAMLTRNPAGLASALEKIASDPNELKSASRAMQHIYIVNPFKKKEALESLWSTHPPIEERIQRLRAMQL